MSRARLIIAALPCVALLAACASDGGSASHRTTGARGVTASGATTASKGLLAPIQAYVDAVGNRDLDALARSFATNAELVDVARHFKGREAIRGWADREVIGGTLEVLEVAPMTGGQDLLVRFSPGGMGGFRAHYRFTVGGNEIITANLQYA